MEGNSERSFSSHKRDSEISGSLKETSYAKILGDLYYGKCTGYLYLESDINLKIQFLHGYVQFVESNDPDLLLGKLLVANDMISEEDQREIIDFSVEKGIQVGQALIQLGKLTSHELSYILDLQMKLKLLNGFRFIDGSYRFVYTDGIDTDTCYHINPIQIIYDAIDSYIYLEPYDFREYNSGGNIYPSLNMNKVSDIRFSSSKHYKLIDMLRKPLSINQILSNSPMDREHTLKMLQFLKLAQFIRIEFDT